MRATWTPTGPFERSSEMKKIIGDFATEVRMTGEEAKEICKLGQMSECCAFLVVGPDGFECIRMSYPNNSTIFSRLANGTMNAKGEGRWKGCVWEEETSKEEKP
jgi:hypothetical protein